MSWTCHKHCDSTISLFITITYRNKMATLYGLYIDANAKSLHSGDTTTHSVASSIGGTVDLPSFSVVDSVVRMRSSDIVIDSADGDAIATSDGTKLSVSVPLVALDGVGSGTSDGPLTINNYSLIFRQGVDGSVVTGLHYDSSLELWEFFDNIHSADLEPTDISSSAGYRAAAVSVGSLKVGSVAISSSGSILTTASVSPGSIGSIDHPFGTLYATALNIAGNMVTVSDGGFSFGDDMVLGGGLTTAEGFNVNLNGSVTVSGMLVQSGDENQIQTGGNGILVNGSIIMAGARETALASIDAGNRTDCIVLPRGSASDRPTVSEAGMLRYNTDDQVLEVRTSDGWLSVVADGGGEDSTLWRSSTISLPVSSGGESRTSQTIHAADVADGPFTLVPIDMTNDICICTDYTTGYVTSSGASSNRFYTFIRDSETGEWSYAAMTGTMNRFVQVKIDKTTGLVAVATTGDSDEVTTAVDIYQINSDGVVTYLANVVTYEESPAVNIIGLDFKDGLVTFIRGNSGSFGAQLCAFSNTGEGWYQCDNSPCTILESPLFVSNLMSTCIVPVEGGDDDWDVIVTDMAGDPVGTGMRMRIYSIDSYEIDINPTTTILHQNNTPTGFYYSEAYPVYDPDHSFILVFAPSVSGGGVLVYSKIEGEWTRISSATLGQTDEDGAARRSVSNPQAGLAGGVGAVKVPGGHLITTSTNNRVSIFDIDNDGTVELLDSFLPAGALYTTIVPGMTPIAVSPNGVTIVCSNNAGDTHALQFYTVSGGGVSNEDISFVTTTRARVDDLYCSGNYVRLPSGDDSEVVVPTDGLADAPDGMLFMNTGSSSLQFTSGSVWRRVPSQASSVVTDTISLYLDLDTPEAHVLSYTSYGATSYSASLVTGEGYPELTLTPTGAVFPDATSSTMLLGSCFDGRNLGVSGFRILGQRSNAGLAPILDVFDSSGSRANGGYFFATFMVIYDPAGTIISSPPPPAEAPP